MVRIYQPRNELEVAMLRSILTSCEIPHFVQNDHLGRLWVGPVIPHLNAKAICVGADWADEAAAVVRDYLEATGGICYHPTGADKIRNVLEFLFFAGSFHVPYAASRQRMSMTTRPPANEALQPTGAQIAALLNAWSLGNREVLCRPRRSASSLSVDKR